MRPRRILRRLGLLGLLGLLTALSWPAAVQAGDWYTLAVNDQMLVVVDRHAVTASRHAATVQEVQIFAHPHALAGTAAPVRRLDIGLDIDCRRGQFRPARFIARDEAGTALLDWPADAQQAQWQAPATGSANAFLLQAVCQRRWDGARLRTGGDILQLQRLFVAAATGQ